MSLRHKIGVILGGVTLLIIGINSATLAYEENEEPIEYVDEEWVDQKEEAVEKVVLYRVETQKERITRKIHAVFPEEPRMVKVATCESQLNPDAIGPDGRDHGVFQIRDIHNAGNMFDEDANIAFARVIYDRNGLRDWDASRWCWYK